MARISQAVIDRVRDTADIVEVVSQYVDLKKRGRNFFGLCPFHHEKTASFSVAPDKNIYHCFGCGAGGSAINFLMEYEKISFVEAVKKLGDRYGIEVELDQDGSSKEFFSQLYEIHNLAAKEYNKLLLGKSGAKARKYLLDRGLTVELLKEFQIGLAPDSWEHLIGLAREKKFTNEVLDKSGLFTKSDKGRFDRFRSRIMFPIANSSGKIIAFGGRVFGTDDPAKYLNSPETPLYHKSDVLFGLDKTREAIRAAGEIILVEGPMDFLALYQVGIKNLVAVSGTALTERHAAQIRKVAPKVLLAYDGDEAGIGATLRSGYTLFRGGVEPLAVEVPAGQDPDDWVRATGPDTVRIALKKAKPLIEFHLDRKQADQLAGVERSNFVKELLVEIARIDDGIIRSELLKAIGNRLGIDERDLLQVLQKQKRRRSFNPEPIKADVQRPLEFSNRLQKAQVEIVRVLASGEKAALDYAKEHLDLQVFSEPLLQTMAAYFLKTSGGNPAVMLEKLETKIEREAATRLLIDDISNEDDDRSKILQECLLSIRQHPIREEIKTLRLKIRDAEAAGQDATEQIIKVARLQRNLNELETGAAES